MGSVEKEIGSQIVLTPAKFFEVYQMKNTTKKVEPQVLTLDGYRNLVRSRWTTLDVADCKDWDVPQLRPIIEGIAAAGNLIWIVGNSHLGKTLFALYIGTKLLLGGSLFEMFPIKPVEKVLYFLLEDPPRRIKSRLLDFETQVEEKGCFLIKYWPGFTFTEDNDEGWNLFLAELGREKPDVIFIDTYQRVTPNMQSFDDEKQNPILQTLQGIAQHKDILMFINDHTRKTPNVRGSRSQKQTSADQKGTMNKLANADGQIILQRHNKTNLLLTAVSKEFDKEVCVELVVAKQGSGETKYKVVNDLSGQEETGKSKTKDKKKNTVYEALVTGEFRQMAKLIEATKLPKTTITNKLKLLIDENLVEQTPEGTAPKLVGYRRIDKPKKPMAKATGLVKLRRNVEKIRTKNGSGA